jgi:hypothetical protein
MTTTAPAMRWIEVRFRTLGSPIREHVLSVHTDLRNIERWLTSPDHARSIDLEIGAAELPLEPTSTLTGSTDRLQVLCDRVNAPNSLLHAHGSVAWFPDLNRLQIEPPAHGDMELRLELWVRPPLMDKDQRRCLLKFTFDQAMIAASNLQVKLFTIHAGSSNATGANDGGVRNVALRALVNRKFALRWRDAPAVLDTGKLKTTLVNGLWTRRLHFRAPSATARVWTVGMEVSSDGAHAGGPAVKVGPFGCIAFDRAAAPSDLSSWQSPMELGSDPVLASGWALRQASGVGTSQRPANADARPTRIWNRIVARLLESLIQVKGSDPASTAFTVVDDTSEAWAIGYRVWFTQPAWQAELTAFECSEPIEFTARCDAFRDHGGKPLERRWRVLSAKLDPSASRIELALRDTTPPMDGPWVRVGALDLSFVVPADGAAPDSSIKLELSPPEWPSEVVGGSASLNLRLHAFRPVSQDPERGQSTANEQLLIPIGESAVRGKLVLTVDESAWPEKSHALSLELSGAREQRKFDLLVLDAEPFLVARVRADLASEGRIGNWAGGDSWELLDTTSSVDVFLPPQAVGEETVKRYRPDPAQPHAEPVEDDAFYIPAGAALAYLYSPPAALGLRRSVFEQSFTEAPWNLRRLLGSASEEFPGAPLEAATTELLYGLNVNLTGDALAVRVTEALHRAGPIAVFAKPERSERVERARRLIASRVAQLEPYRVNESGPWSAGARAQFRPGRRAADPISPSNPQQPYERVRGKHQPGEAWGLRGGVDWGFESRNILNEVTGKGGVSSSAMVARLRMSALGGSGLVKASFANDKSTIYAEAFLGRTFYTSIERIGRIAILWNVAKHVIVYERSTAASAQFPDPQGEWTGRPVLRKVREIIQVTEHERAFPDPQSQAKGTGFVTAARFPAEPIEVDSRWGRDIPGGWEVPLHRKGRDPAPVVRLGLAGVHGETGDTVWAALQNPEHLYFFTSTRPEDDANTNEWRAVPGVDYPLQPIPIRGEDPSLRASDASRPDAPALEAGLRRFTFDLDAGGAVADLNRQRSDSRVGAVLENVTLARRAPRDLVPTPALGSALDELANVTSASQQIDGLRGQALTATAETFPSKIDDYVVKVTELLAQPAPHPGDPLANALGALKKLQDESPLPDLTGWVESVAVPMFKDPDATAKQVAAGVAAEAKSRLVQVQNTAADLLERWRTAGDRLEVFRDRFDAELGRIGAELQAQHESPPEAWGNACRAAVARLVLLAADARNQLGPDFAGAFKASSEAFGSTLTFGLALSPAERTREAIDGLLRGFRQPIALALDELSEALCQLDGLARDFEALLEGKLPANLAENLEEALLQGADAARRYLLQKLEAYRSDLVGAVPNFSKEFTQTHVAALLGPVLEHLPDARELAAMGTLAKQLAPNALASLRAIEESLSLPLRALDGRRQALADRIEAFGRSLDAKQSVEDLGAQGLRLLRAFGGAPSVRGLEFTRGRLAYFFHQPVAGGAVALLDGIHFTPCNALVDKAANQLKALRIQLPASGLADTLQADAKALAGSLLRNVLPDFAGIRLSDLFAGSLSNAGDGPGIRVRHGFDDATRQAWVECDVKLNRAHENLFGSNSFGLALHDLRLDAFSRVEVDARGARTQRTRGALTADWLLMVGGANVLSLRGARADFNDGQLQFQIDPRKIEIPGALQFLAKLLATASPPEGSGMGIEVVCDGGMPVGVRAVLGLALPTLGFGIFSLSNLALRGYLEVALRDRITVAAGLGLSSRERPFQLAVLFLSGGGWFEAGLVFEPSKPLGSILSVGIAAGASLLFNIGVAAGGVSCLLDAGIESRNGAIRFIVGITLAGELRVLGLVSVSLVLRLELRYQSDNSLYGSGRLRLKIRICWFIKINVDVGFDIRLAGGSRQALAAAALEATDPVAEYLSFFRSAA